MDEEVIFITMLRYYGNWVLFHWACSLTNGLAHLGNLFLDRLMYDPKIIFSKREVISN